jgi:hypothetical protein
MDRGQSQSISFSRLLGSKGRLEQTGTGFGVHAATRVANRKRDPIAKLVTPVTSRYRPIAVPDAQRDPTAIRHGIARVQSFNTRFRMVCCA